MIEGRAQLPEVSYTTVNSYPAIAVKLESRRPVTMETHVIIDVIPKNPPLAKNYPWSQLGYLNEKIRTPLSKIKIAREARKKKIGFFSVLQCKNTLKWSKN